MKKKIVFITGTRADYGKLKSLIDITQQCDDFSVHIFATGMHLLEKYGSTVHEIFKQGTKNIYMYNNSPFAGKMELMLSNTINGLSSYISEMSPDLIIVHGDRPEALAGAIVGAFNNILVGHIEGGELSGTIDELVRHSISKLSHVHFVSNESAKKRIVQMGEKKDDIFVIGSPELDLMLSDKLPELNEIRQHYNIKFETFGIMIMHPVTTDLEATRKMANNTVAAALGSGEKFIVVLPNNDTGSEIILKEYEKLDDDSKFLVLPSIRFEYFLTLLKNCMFILGNSSVGVREAPVFGKPSINIVSRQLNRSKSVDSIFQPGLEKDDIKAVILEIISCEMSFPENMSFGSGNSSQKFLDVLNNDQFWATPIQKQFIELGEKDE